MYQDLPIQDIYAREILDSRGNPTVEVEILAGEKIVGRAAVPSGASTGKFEAVELRDREKRYGGKGVEQAVRHVNEEIAEALIGKNVLAQTEIDHILKELDGSIDKHNLGANAILGVSLAAAKTAAAALRIPLYDYLGNVGEKVMPIPMMNVLNGGAHADNNLDIQEFMLVPYGPDSFKERLRMGTEIYHVLRTLLKQKGLTTAVGDEGGFAPELRDSREAIEFLIEAAHQAGYQPGKDVGIALDVAASEIYRAKEQRYYFVGESKKSGKKIARTSDEMMEYYERLILDYPIYEQITSQIKAMIMNGELKAGDPMPSMRKLAKELHVSVITTQRAYDDLQKDGFIVTVPAKGTFVSAQNQDFIREENRRRVELLLTDAVELAKENGIELEELRTTLDVLYQEEDV